jgi:uncharacterized lipoprotein YajG
MGLKSKKNTAYILFLIIGLYITACAGSSYINVRYQLPPPSDKLKGRAVFLDFKDMRTEKIFLSPTAQNEFKKFSGLFSLYLAKENKKDELLGGFSVETLFKEALKSRLETMGVKVVSERPQDLPVIEIGLKEFSLDYKNIKWITNISYQARLLKDQGTTATENVSITGERMKTLGRGNVEKYLSEIFSDSLNKLNVRNLFQQVGL